MIFHSGILGLPSHWIVCIYYRFLFYGYPEAYLKHLIDITDYFDLITDYIYDVTIYIIFYFVSIDKLYLCLYFCPLTFIPELCD